MNTPHHHRRNQRGSTKITVRALYTLAIVGFYCGTLCGATLPVRVSGANPRVLVDQDNVPLLIVGDSPHSLFSNLSTADAAVYLADRAARGINSLSVNLLCIRPVEGRSDGSLLDGTKPFTNTIAGTRFYDLTTPNASYFTHVDEVLHVAATDRAIPLCPIRLARRGGNQEPRLAFHWLGK